MNIVPTACDFCQYGQKKGRICYMPGCKNGNKFKQRGVEDLEKEIESLKNRLELQDEALKRAGSAARFAVSEEDARKLRGIVFTDNGDELEKEIVEEANLLQDRDALKAKVSSMIWALGEIRGPMCCGTCANLVLAVDTIFCCKDSKDRNNDDWCKDWRGNGWREVIAHHALSINQSEAAERVEGLLETLEAIATHKMPHDGEMVSTKAAVLAAETLAEWRGEK